MGIPASSVAAGTRMMGAKTTTTTSIGGGTHGGQVVVNLSRKPPLVGWRGIVNKPRIPIKPQSLVSRRPDARPIRPPITK